MAIKAPNQALGTGLFAAPGFGNCHSSWRQKAGELVTLGVVCAL
jgi:hypothetical protein